MKKTDSEIEVLKPYKCSHCDSAFESEKILLQHLAASHLFCWKKMFLSEYQNFLCSFNVSTADLLNIFLMILSIIKKLSMIKSTLLYLVKMKPKTSSCLLVVRLYDSKIGRQFAYLPKCKMFLLILHMYL